MPSRKEGLLVIYPEYFDSALTKKEGRRVPRNLACKEPTPEAIARAAEASDASLEPKIESKSSHPRFWWEKRGRVLVRKRQSKQKTLLMIARKL